MKNLETYLTLDPEFNVEMVNHITKNISEGNVTDLEYKVLCHLICSTNSSYYFEERYEDLCKILDIDMKCLKGVVGSLVKKNLVVSEYHEECEKPFYYLDLPSYTNDKYYIRYELEYLREWITEYGK